MVLTLASGYVGVSGEGSVDSGEYTLDGNIGTWTGSAASLKFTNVHTAQMRIAKIEITLGE